jgi:hypothetical protein
MQISDFMPSIQPMAENVSRNLRFACFFILTSAIIIKASRSSRSISSLMRPLVTVAVIVGLIATLPFWFNLARGQFWNIALLIREEFASSVAPTGSALLQLIQPPEEGINWFDITDSLIKAVQYALGWMIVWLGGVIQLPMMLFQHLMECLCYMFLPVALSLYSLDGTRGLAIRYTQQTLAILAWPIGFAVVDLVAYSLLTSVVAGVSAGAVGIGLATGFTPATMIIGGIVAIWLLLGSLATPIIMQMLFCSGSPVASALGQSLHMGTSLMNLGRFIRSGPSPTSIPAAASSISIGGVPTTVVNTSSMTPEIPRFSMVQPSATNDPTGDELANRAVASKQVAQAVRY